MEPVDAEVLADVVATLDAAPAVAARRVRGPGHAAAHLPAEIRCAGTQLHDLAAPLVAGHQRPVLGPEARKVALDDVRVGAADRGRPDPAEHLETLRPRPFDLADAEVVRSGDDKRAHQLTPLRRIAVPSRTSSSSFPRRVTVW